MVRTLCTISLLLILATGVSATDDPVVLRAKPPKVGDVFRETTRTQMKDADFSVTATDGTSVTLKMSEESEQEIEQKVLEMDGDSVTKFETKFIKDEKTTRLKKPGAKEEKSEEIGDLAGQVVITTKVKGKWTHAIKDGEPTEKQRLGLLALTGWDDDDSTPAGQQKVGTTWDVNSTHLTKVMGPGITSVSGKGKATFARVEKFQGDLSAVVEMTGKYKGKMKVEEKEVGFETDLKETTYTPLKRTYTKSITEGTIKVAFKGDGGDQVEIKGKVKTEIETEKKD